MRDAPDTYEQALREPPAYDNPHRCEAFRVLQTPPFMSRARQKCLIVLARAPELAFITNADAERLIADMGPGDA